MINFLFTIDYEIFGNGTGELNELVFEPARRLQELFRKYDARFVNFVEAAEFEKIEAFGSDSAVDLVRTQIREMYHEGFEIALHLHPQWANARRENGQWILDLDEYNLCTLPRPRITEIVSGALNYVRYVLDRSDFTPISFRAGNWLFQPTATAASVLGEAGIRIDSSVFKGGLQHNHNLDYRRASRNGYFWSFSNDANRADPNGQWIEVPIHTRQVPLWKMVTPKRTAYKNQFGVGCGSLSQKVRRALDFARFLYPLKLDFCRMTLAELTDMMGRVVRQDRQDPDTYRPIVAIGHTKDLTDFATVDAFLLFLKENRIPVVTFPDIYPKLTQCALGHRQAAAKAFA
jgi:hypothetical protein